MHADCKNTGLDTCMQINCKKKQFYTHKCRLQNTRLEEPSVRIERIEIAKTQVNTHACKLQKIGLDTFIQIAKHRFTHIHADCRKTG